MKPFILRHYFISSFLIFIIAAACSSDSETVTSPSPTPNTPKGIALEIDPSIVFQTISGFGGANQMWGTTFPTAADMKKAFGTGDDELGLSIFRIRIPSNRNEWPNIVEVSREAIKYNAKIIASPWSPPAELKSNNSDVGGFLPSENYPAYLEHINDFIAFMDSNGVDIYAVSIQNEPDIQVGYESSDWTPDQMADFLREYGSQIEGVQVAAAESFNFTRSFTDVLLNDNEVAENIDIIAGHIYGGGLGSYPLAEQKGKEIWMTEYLMNHNATSSWANLTEQEIWKESLEMLSTVHDAMESNWNAYIWWYLKRYYSFLGDGTQGTTNGEILRRGYAFSHFSKFVRNGYQRIEANIASEPEVLVSAYKGENQIVVQVINTTDKAKPIINFFLEGARPSNAKSYVTSLYMSRQQNAVTLDPVNSESSLTLSLQAKSITTIVFDY